jgi:hypothetical protein
MDSILSNTGIIDNANIDKFNNDASTVISSCGKRYKKTGPGPIYNDNCDFINAYFSNSGLSFSTSSLCYDDSVFYYNLMKEQPYIEQWKRLTKGFLFCDSNSTHKGNTLYTRLISTLSFADYMPSKYGATRFFKYDIPCYIRPEPVFSVDTSVLIAKTEYGKGIELIYKNIYDWVSRVMCLSWAFFSNSIPDEGKSRITFFTSNAFLNNIEHIFHIDDYDTFHSFISSAAVNAVSFFESFCGYCQDRNPKSVLNSENEYPEFPFSHESFDNLRDDLIYSLFSTIRLAVRRASMLNPYEYFKNNSDLIKCDTMKFSEYDTTITPTSINSPGFCSKDKISSEIYDSNNKIFSISFGENFQATDYPMASSSDVLYAVYANEIQVYKSVLNKCFENAENGIRISIVKTEPTSDIFENLGEKLLDKTGLDSIALQCELED